jgi:hypothetical protein
MIPNFLIYGNKIKGSSLMSPANGLGGSRATILFLFSFLKAAAAPALRALKQAGKKEGGLGEGIFARLRFPRRRRGWGESVSAVPPKAEYQNRKIFFSLIEKNFGGARLKKCRENFSVLLAEAKRRRAETLGGIQSAKSSGFCSKKVRISSKQYRQFTISAFWAVFASRLRRSAGALRAQRADFERICHAPRGKKEMFWFWIKKFVLAKPKAKRSFANQSFFVPPLAERKAIIF